MRNVLKKGAERQKKDATAHDLREKSKKRQEKRKDDNRLKISR